MTLYYNIMMCISNICLYMYVGDVSFPLNSILPAFFTFFN